MTTYYSTYNIPSWGIGAIIATTIIFITISIFITVIILGARIWIYQKAGRKWWEAILPIYNMVVLLEIVDLPLWYIALLFVPFANIYAMFKIYIELAHKFGKSTIFGIITVCIPIICLPMLAFGSATYLGIKKDNFDCIYCSECGDKNEKEAKFCKSCGAKIKG